MQRMLNRFSQARILVVDDDRLNQHLIANALGKAGFSRIDTANDGADALVKTCRVTPDLVILDLQMPNLDGFEYCERVRNYVELPRMPIIVQTISDKRDEKLRALSCGADDFLHKPLDMDELNLRAAVHLERYFMLQELANMNLYLKMELGQVQGLLRQAEKAHISNNVLNLLNRHCEVLETMTVLPAYGT